MFVANSKMSYMKKATLLLLLGLITLTFSCKKDPCEGKVCLYGGTCVNGNCICANGYTGASCETPPNSCLNITCLNGGYCANGLCVCPTGYTGANCSQQVTPTKIRITKITVTQFPATDGGAGWDLTSGPELYPTVSFGGTTLWNSPTYYADANPSLDYDFTPSPAIDLNSPTSQYTIRIYDYDTSDPDDYMGGILFYPYNSSNGFPSSITIDAGAGVAFKLYLSYLW